MNNAPLKPEIQFLLLCARSELDDETENQARHLISSPSFDWSYAYSIGLELGLLPLIYAHVKKPFRSMVPDVAYKKIHDFYMANAARNMVLTHELLKILKLLSADGLPAVPFKGPVLADVVYGSDTLRTFSDIDVLVQASDAVKAREILQANGYRLVYAIDKKYDDLYVRIEHAFNLQSPDGKINIDLQWKLLGHYTPEPFVLEKFKHRLIRLNFAGTDVAHLSHEDLLFYLCVHGTKDGWKKFEWVCCIAELIRKHPDINWSGAIETARKESCLRKFKLGLFLAWNLCKVPLPDFIEEELKGDKVLKRLSERFNESFFAGTRLIPEFTNNPRFSLFHVQVQDDWKNRFRFVFQQIFRPTEKEIRLLPVPTWLTFIYYAFRPIRLGWRLVSYYFKNRPGLGLKRFYISCLLILIVSNS